MSVALFAHAHRVANTEALSSFGFQYLSETYLPLKLQEVRRSWATDGLGGAECTLLCLAGRLDLNRPAYEVQHQGSRYARPNASERQPMCGSLAHIFTRCPLKCTHVNEPVRPAQV